MRELDNSNHDYSENIAEAIKKHFDDNDFPHAFDEDNGIFMASINIGDKLNTIKLILHVHDDAFTIYFVIPVNAGKKVRSKVTEFITRANYGMRCANFEMDYSDGEIRLKIFTPVHTEELSDYTIGFSIFLGVTIIKRYAGGLLEVVLGFNTPEQAIEKIESNDDDDDDDDDDIDDDDDDIDDDDKKP